MAGGYDNNQDQQTPASQDSVGRALFAINAAAGQLVSNFSFNGTTSGIGMTHSIVDMTALDHDGDGIVSRIYAGDLGGNVFAFKDDTLHTYTVCSQSVEQVVTDGIWTTAFKLFNASADGVQRKILYAPDAIGEDLGKKDRSISIGTAIPSAPVIAILADGAQIFIGVEGGIVSLPTIATQDMYSYYWTQVF